MSFTPLSLLFHEQQAKCIASELFKVCWSCAKGSFRHSCCVLDYLLQNYTDQVCVYTPTVVLLPPQVTKNEVGCLSDVLHHFFMS